MDSPKHEVYWYTLKKPKVEPLNEDIEADIVIIGGGMAGLTVANNLLQRSKSELKSDAKVKPSRIVILEKEFCGGGASGKSSGFITPDSELEFADLHKKYGKPDAKILWNYALGGLEEIRKTIKDYNIDCDYEEQDSLFVANTEKNMKEIRDEHELQSKSGYENQLYGKAKLQEILDSSEYFGGVRTGKTFGVSAYLYCQKMKEELVMQGVKIYEDTLVEQVKPNAVHTNKKNISVETIIVCVDKFLPSLKIYPKSVYHAQTFLTVSRPLSEKEMKLIFPKEKMMVWDTDLIYQYYRMIGGNRLMFGAANLLYTYLPNTIKDPKNVLETIRNYQLKKFGKAFEVEYVWPGLIGVSKDFLPLVGRHHRYDNIYYISGCAGLPWAAASGKYIAEKVLYGRADMDRFFTARRKFPIGSFVQTFLRKPIVFALSHGLVKYFK